jgi:hypothetical protein
MAPSFTARLLARYDVCYLRCSQCEFLCTETPYWLAEAYSQAIAATDTGIVLRNLRIAKQLTCVLPQLFGAKARFLDVAGGTGLLARLMRDNGFDFYWEDLYCQNVLAFGFDAAAHTGAFDAVTAFEALEHMEKPYDFIRECVERSTTGTFLFTTELFVSPKPAEDWWYFTRATGQHISFFSTRTLLQIAQNLQLRFLTHGGLHLLTRMPISENVYKSALDRVDHGLFDQTMASRTGLTWSDHIAMTTRVMQAQGASEAEIAQLRIPATSAPQGEAGGSDVLEATKSAAGRARGKWMERTMAKWQRSFRKRFRKA